MSKDTANERSELVKRRKELDLTQEDIANAVGVSVQTVSNWENKRAAPRLTIPQFKTLGRLLQYSSLEDFPDSFGPPESDQS